MIKTSLEHGQEEASITVRFALSSQNQKIEEKIDKHNSILANCNNDFFIFQDLSALKLEELCCQR